MTPLTNTAPLRSKASAHLALARRRIGELTGDDQSVYPIRGQVIRLKLEKGMPAELDNAVGP